MEQMKIGRFIKALRKEKGITQEQAAEIFGVSRRTVSRWETGSNLPDLDVLIEMADYFAVDLRELLDGERKGKQMDKELEETVLKVADYSNEGKRRFTRGLHILFFVGLAAEIIYLVLLIMERADNFLGSLCQGFTFGLMLVGVIVTSRSSAKIRAFKMRLLQRLGNSK